MSIYAKSEIKQFTQRWEDAAFLEQQHSVLSFFENAAPLEGADIKGLHVGGSKSTKGFGFYSFKRRSLTDVDADTCCFETSFNSSEISFCRFREATFDHCDFYSSQLIGNDFSNSKFKSPSFQDTVIRKSTFVDAYFHGLKILTYGGRRIQFEDCDFTGAKFKNLYFLATRFKNCNFANAVFEKSSLKGVKFEECIINEDNFTACDLESVTVDAEAINEIQLGGWQHKAQKILDRLGIEPEKEK